MGSFSYSCRLTGLPIAGSDRAVIIPVLPKESWYDNSENHIRKYGTANFCSNDGPEVFFKPVMFPIFGEYSSYGSLENIEEDDNTRTLEAHFGLSIQEIVDIMCSGRKDDGYDDCLAPIKKNPKKEKGANYKEEYDILIKSSIVWMRREVYDGLAASKSPDAYFDKIDMGVPAVLKFLGFKETGKSKDDRFNRIFINGPVELHSDGNWIQIPNKKEHLYNGNDLNIYCKNLGLDISEKIKELASQGETEQSYNLILPEVSKLSHPSSWEGDRIRRLFFKKDYFDEQEMSEVYFSAVKKNGNPFLKKNIIDWHRVSQYFYTTGHFFSPGSTSPQDGDPKGVLTVINIAKKVLEDDIKNRYEDDDEEE